MNFKKLFSKSKTQKNLTKVVNTFASLKLYEFKIVKFCDKTHKHPKLRHWLAFKISDETYCFVSPFTSSEKLPMLYRNNENAMDSLVYIAPDKFNPPFYKDTYLDCNIQDIKHRRTFQELNEEIIDWKYDLEDTKYVIPQDIINDIVKAIINSKFTSPEIKNGFKKKYSHIILLTKN